MSTVISKNINNASEFIPPQQNLKIVRFKKKMMNIIRVNKVVIIYGDSGTGKTTQIPQYILEAGLNRNKIIGITQPYEGYVRQAAKRVAEEMKCNLGKEVGYEINNNEESSTSTKIKFLTEKILLNKALKDGSLKEFGVIIIDEANAKSLETDILFVLLKKIIKTQRNIKILIISASLNMTKLSSFFNNAPIFLVESRLHKVSLIYEPISDKNYFKRSLKIVNKIHKQPKEGDILVFLACQDEVDTFCKRLCGSDNNLKVFNLHRLVERDLLEEVFYTIEIGQRKVIVATNNLGNLITVESVKFVIDCGFSKRKRYDDELGSSLVETIRISKEEAEHRRKKGGWMGKGLCYRLYKKDEYESLSEELEPAVKLKELFRMYFKMTALGFNPMNLKYLHEPDKIILKQCRSKLEDLKLLDKFKNLTDLGKILQYFPGNPQTGKVILSSFDYDCSEDIIIIMSMMKAKNIFIQTKENISPAECCQRAFFDEDGDHFTKLYIYNEFLKNEKSRNWCDSNLLNFDELMKVEKNINQLILLMEGQKREKHSARTSENKDNIKNAILKGYFHNICVRECSGTYRRYFDNKVFYIHPNSSLFNENCRLIVYHKSLQTKKPFLHGIMKIDENNLKHLDYEMGKLKHIQESKLGKDSITMDSQIEIKFLKPGFSNINYGPENNFENMYDDYDNGWESDNGSEGNSEDIYDDYDDGLEDNSGEMYDDYGSGLEDNSGDMYDDYDNGWENDNEYM